jgi:hypothetical protein
MHGPGNIKVEHICDLSDVFVESSLTFVPVLFLICFCFVFISSMWARPKAGNARLSSSKVCVTALNSSLTQTVYCLKV